MCFIKQKIELISVGKQVRTKIISHENNHDFIEARQSKILLNLPSVTTSPLRKDIIGGNYLSFFDHCCKTQKQNKAVILNLAELLEPEKQ